MHIGFKYMIGTIVKIKWSRTVHAYWQCEEWACFREGFSFKTFRVPFKKTFAPYKLPMWECLGELTLLGINLNKVCSRMKFCCIDHLTSRHTFSLPVSPRMLLYSKNTTEKTTFLSGVPQTFTIDLIWSSHFYCHRVLPNCPSFLLLILITNECQIWFWP